jgi:hypothetical protein
MPKHQHLMKRPSHILIDTRYCPRHLARFSLLDFARHHIEKRVEGRSPQIWGGWSLSGRIGVWSAVGALVAMKVGGKDSVGYCAGKGGRGKDVNVIETHLNVGIRRDFCAQLRNRGERTRSLRVWYRTSQVLFHANSNKHKLIPSNYFAHHSAFYSPVHQPLIRHSLDGPRSGLSLRNSNWSVPVPIHICNM